VKRPPREPSPRASRPELPPIEIAYRDEDLLIVIKPAGIPTTSPDGKNCLVELVQALDPHAPRLHATSRLDAEVTGLVTFARTTLAIEELLLARRNGRYGRCYVALAPHAPAPPSGEWTGTIAHDLRDKRLRTIAGTEGAGTDDLRAAATDYATAATVSLAVALHLRPRTGRTHQLRVHCAAAGLPLLGDTQYGGTARITAPNGRVVAARRVMLHCALLVLPSVTHRSRERIIVRAPIPADMSGVWVALGGDLAALEPTI
jgi:23S rRNA-/tRNA-specific pseudouridylate synthase